MLTERDICCLCCLIPDCKEAADTNGCWDVPSLSLGPGSRAQASPPYAHMDTTHRLLETPARGPTDPAVRRFWVWRELVGGNQALAGSEQGLSRLHPCGVPFPLPSSPRLVAIRIQGQ